ncbi:peptidase associated/transthyretin-like domain-containing protein [Filimonas effusa]|uniref:PEGA domain-containing protein n=1 Tax=Filimonas effusa TaxID=2508721 RepID=A0A4Q1DCJ9_9BACT|nr:hypothetical protein [Filimonas effusa]RXK87172.1 hypothetical protein ESB13_10440 [Filimonas effusa]
MKKLFYVVPAAILVCCFYGCATIVSKSNYPVSVSTDPDKASVVIVDEHDIPLFTGKSPMAVKLKAGRGYFARSSYKIKVSKEGYETQVIPVKFSLKGWYFGNLLFGGIIGFLVVDPLTGAMWKIDQDYFVANLEKSGTKQGTEVALHVKLLSEVTPSEREAMVRLR